MRHFWDNFKGFFLIWVLILLFSFFIWNRTKFICKHFIETIISFVFQKLNIGDILDLFTLILLLIVCIPPLLGIQWVWRYSSRSCRNTLFFNVGGVEIFIYFITLFCFWSLFFSWRNSIFLLKLLSFEVISPLLVYVIQFLILL